MNGQQQDTRSADQRRADDAAVLGTWAGFATENLLTEQGALAILSHCRSLDNKNRVLGNVRGQPFRWKDKVFRILRCECVGGEALVEATPLDAEFVAEVKKRVERDRFHTLTYYQGFGFICFPEDYAKYQD